MSQLKQANRIKESFYSNTFCIIKDLSLQISIFFLEIFLFHFSKTRAAAGKGALILKAARQIHLELVMELHATKPLFTNLVDSKHQ